MSLTAALMLARTMASLLVGTETATSSWTTRCFDAVCSEESGLQSPLLFVRFRICFSRRDTEDGWLRLRSRLKMVRLARVGWKMLCSKHQITRLIAPQACLNNVDP